MPNQERNHIALSNRVLLSAGYPKKIIPNLADSFKLRHPAILSFHPTCHPLTVN